MITATTEWPTGPVKLEWHLAKPAGLPITGSHGFIFGTSGVVVVSVRSRGFTIPGGRLQPPESPVQCLVREAHEEANILIDDPVQLGYIVSDHTINPSFDGPYPVRAAQAVFFANVIERYKFRPTDEIAERKEVPPDELPRLHHEWNEVLGAAYEKAMIASSTT